MYSVRKVSCFCTVIFILIAGSLSISCLKVSTIRYKDDRRSATEATNEFQRLFNDGKFEGIYDLTDERARATKSKPALISMLTALRDDRGKWVSWEPLDSSVKSQVGYTEVTLLFNMKFANSQNKAKFTWYASDGKASLFSLEME